MDQASLDMFFLQELRWVLRNVSTESSTHRNISDILDPRQTDVSTILHFATVFYAYVTPVIVVFGLTGNVVSLCVLASPNLRHLPANRYLSALCLADVATLVFYVIKEWLRRGMTYFADQQSIPVLEVQGLCQLWLFLSYVARFMSAWLIVCFTAERFVAVYRPLRTRGYGSMSITMKTIYALVAVSCLISAYKPFVSEVRTIRGKTACTSAHAHINASFVFDTIYGIFITAIPFLIITTLNILIMYKLFLRNKQQKRISNSSKGAIRAGFTIIVFAISLCFVIFNLPFLIAWLWTLFHLRQSQHADKLTGTDLEYTDTWTAILHISRTIYYMNFSVNFFLYSITGSAFRRHLVALFTGRKVRHQISTNQTTALIKLSPMPSRASTAYARSTV